MKLCDFEVLDEEVFPDDIDTSSLEMKSELNKEIWNEDDSLKPEVKDFALKVANNYIKYMLGNLEIKPIDVQFTGSLANYNWSEYSDFDIHIVVDYSKISSNIELVGEFFRNKTTIYRLDHSYDIKGFEVELNTNNIEKIKKDVGIYSLLHDKWIQHPNVENITIDYNSIKNKASQLMNIIDNSLDNLDDLKSIKKKLRKMRQTAIDSNGEFATENIAFKVLRRLGYIEKLTTAIKNLEPKI